MDNVIVFDSADVHGHLLPISYTRPTGAIRVGILTIAEKWRHEIPGTYSWQPSESYLREKFPVDPVAAGSLTTLYVAGHVFPDAALASRVRVLKPGEALYAMTGGETPELVARRGASETCRIEYPHSVEAILRPCDIFLLNGDEIAADFKRLVSGRASQSLSTSNTVIGDAGLVFVEEGATVEGAFLNTTKGPVYIGADAEVMEGSMLRGPVAVCADACVNMGARIYPSTTIGPFCKVGGEVNNVVMLGYSNKAHDGFLGNAVIGEWCNLGAGCVASNLKNDYTPIKLWDYPAHRFLPTGLQFCGLIMGDHSKAGVNTMINTATVVGVGVNIHGSGFPRNFVASFSEGGAAGFADVVMSKFFATARKVMERRGCTLSPADERMYLAIRDIAERYK